MDFSLVEPNVGGPAVLAAEWWSMDDKHDAPSRECWAVIDEDGRVESLWTDLYDAEQEHARMMDSLRSESPIGRGFQAMVGC
jgi:hypothetical protein